MNDKISSDQKAPDRAKPKKPYKAPSFKFEPVFEVSALSCGKLSSTQSGCHHVRKAS